MTRKKNPRMGRPRQLPTPGRVRKLMIRTPFRTDTEWAQVWGCSVSRVQELRRAAGVPPVSEIRKAASAFVRETSNGRGA